MVSRSFCNEVVDSDGLFLFLIDSGLYVKVGRPIMSVLVYEIEKMKDMKVMFN